jgi:hypothetical protein
MRSTSKKKLKKYESLLTPMEKPNRGVAIYNPDSGISVIDCPFVIALPDKRMDPKLTEKIGNSYVFL